MLDLLDLDLDELDPNPVVAGSKVLRLLSGCVEALGATDGRTLEGGSQQLTRHSGFSSLLYLGTHSSTPITLPVS